MIKEAEPKPYTQQRYLEDCEPLSSRAVLCEGGSLAPCPFCGSTNVYIKTRHDFAEVYCQECECRGPWGSIVKCKELWNKRANFA